MIKGNLTPRFLVLAGMILAAALSRLIPHPPNFTAVAAMALFGGAYFSKRSTAFSVPLIAMFLTDLILGFHQTIYAVYISFILIVMIGFSLREKKKPGSIILASVSASVLFFIVTNFAQWLSDPFYTKNAAGFVQCFTLAIPFFHYTLLGDLFFAGIMFGAFELIKVKFPVLAKVTI